MKLGHPVFLLAVAALLTGAAPTTAPSGDLNLDGEITVVDLQCMVITYSTLILFEESGAGACDADGDCAAGLTCRVGFSPETLCLPACLSAEVALGDINASPCEDPGADHATCLGLTARRNADLDCSGALDSGDLNFLVALLLGKTGGPGTADMDGDGRLNFCDDDSDDDAVPDPVDPAPLDPTIPGVQAEECNGVDDDGDGDIDEEDAEGCTLHYPDEDLDGFGAASPSKCLCQPTAPFVTSVPGDCYDDNGMAKPGQTAYLYHHRGDGSFDWDCDGAETLEIDTLFWCSSSCSSYTEGWHLSKPGCGNYGTYVVWCLPSGSWACDTGGFQTQAACR